MYDKHISAEKQASLELAEASREAQWHYPSFALQLFHGRLDWRLIHPFPTQSPEDKREGDVFIARLEKFIKENLDPNKVDETGEIPEHVYKGLADLGAFAIKIPKEYGGLGLSQLNYNRAMHLLASYCGSTTVLLSAHQSIGVPQPLKLFGTKEQKEKYFPMFAKGKISAFALTEEEAGSDPRNMKTTAVPTADGQFFILNGEKLWCTNGPIADVLVVMAVTPPKVVDGREIKQITAFIVETETPGFEVVHRCRFMGLNGIQNGLVRFTNVKVPRENIILGEGQGLKLALTTLNTGRLTLPAASVGVAKWCLHVARQWARERVQWGAPIGEHESIALKLGDMACQTFAMEAMTWLVSTMADDKNKDIRIEAAMAKHFCTQLSWRIADETLQIRAGQGYETQTSLKARGVTHCWPVERVLRDIRINLIIEGTSEIMHLFLAREALDPHLTRLKPLLSSRARPPEKFKALLRMLVYYGIWYPKLWFPSVWILGDLHPKLRGHVGYVQSTARRLGRSTFHRMLKYQKKLEARQAILNRMVDIGTELFAIAASCAYADSLLKGEKGKENALDLADLYCQTARGRIEGLFRENQKNFDRQKVKISRQLLDEKFLWMEEGIVK